VEQTLGGHAVHRRVKTAEYIGENPPHILAAFFQVAHHDADAEAGSVFFHQFAAPGCGAVQFLLRVGGAAQADIAGIFRQRNPHNLSALAFTARKNFFHQRRDNIKAGGDEGRRGGKFTARKNRVPHGDPVQPIFPPAAANEIFAPAGKGAHIGAAAAQTFLV